MTNWTRRTLMGIAAAALATPLSAAETINITAIDGYPAKALSLIHI